MKHVWVRLSIQRKSACASSNVQRAKCNGQLVGFAQRRLPLSQLQPLQCRKRMAIHAVRCMRCTVPSGRMPHATSCTWHEALERTGAGEHDKRSRDRRRARPCAHLYATGEIRAPRDYTGLFRAFCFQFLVFLERVLRFVNRHPIKTGSQSPLGTLSFSES